MAAGVAGPSAPAAFRRRRQLTWSCCGVGPPARRCRRLARQRAGRPRTLHRPGRCRRRRAPARRRSGLARNEPSAVAAPAGRCAGRSNSSASAAIAAGDRTRYESLEPRAETKPEDLGLVAGCFTTNGARSTLIRPNGVCQEIPTPAPTRGAGIDLISGHTPVDTWSSCRSRTCLGQSAHIDEGATGQARDRARPAAESVARWSASR